MIFNDGDGMDCAQVEWESAAAISAACCLSALCPFFHYYVSIWCLLFLVLRGGYSMFQVDCVSEDHRNTFFPRVMDVVGIIVPALETRARSDCCRERARLQTSTAFPPHMTPRHLPNQQLPLSSTTDTARRAECCLTSANTWCTLLSTNTVRVPQQTESGQHVTWSATFFRGQGRMCSTSHCP